MISGARVGLDYNKTFKFGLGYRWLRKEIQHSISISDKPTNAEYTFYNVKPFALGYYPITTNKMCMQCHGTPTKQIKPETFAKLQSLYPKGPTTNYDILKLFK